MSVSNVIGRYERYGSIVLQQNNIICNVLHINTYCIALISHKAKEITFFSFNEMLQICVHVLVTIRNIFVFINFYLQ